MMRGKREDTEGSREAEFIVLDFIKSTPNATVPEIATLINDVGADLNYIARVMGIDPAVARQAYNQVINVAPPIQQVIDKQAQSTPVNTPTRPLDKVIDTSRPAFTEAEVNAAVGELTSGAKTPEQVAQEYGVSVDFVNSNLERIQNEAFNDIQAGNKTAQQVADQFGLGLDFVTSTFDRVQAERAAQSAPAVSSTPATQNVIPTTTTPATTTTTTPAVTSTQPASTVSPVNQPPVANVASPVVATVPDAVDPNLNRNALTGAMAGPQLPVGLAAAEQAIRGGAGTATGLLSGAAGAAGQELTGGTLGGIGALRTGINQARQDITQGTATGLAGLQAGLANARADIQSGFNRAENTFSPFTTGGNQALQQQLALSGALGQDAFNQAYSESPQMQFLREQGERAALRTAGARGGLGGGRVMQELARYNTGLASQDLQNQIANLGALSAQGLNATGSAANIATGGAQQLASLGVLGGTSALQAAQNEGINLSNLAQQLGASEADLRTALGAGRANIALGTGTRAADLAAQTGVNLANMRTRAGENLANQFGTASSQLADLQQAQGAGTANMIGAQTNAINQLTTAAAAGDAAAQTELARLQATINQGIGANLAGVPAAQFVPSPNPAGSILQGAALGYELGNMFTPTAQQTTANPGGFFNNLYTQMGSNPAALPGSQIPQPGFTLGGNLTKIT